MTLTINKADPTFSFSDLTKTFGDPNFDLSTSSNSNGIITFTISNTSVARLNPITADFYFMLTQEIRPLIQVLEIQFMI